MQVMTPAMVTGGSIRTMSMLITCRFYLQFQYPMARKARRNGYTKKGTDQVFKVGDCVVMKPEDNEEPPYIARVGRVHNQLKVAYYYRPEDTVHKRKPFLGKKELFESNHLDYQSADTILGKCIVHSFEDYTKLDPVRDDDYFSRFMYDWTNKTYTPHHVQLYCKCELPYNPDEWMLHCDKCKDRYHPACVEMTTVQAKKLKKYLCDDCVPK